MSVLNRFRIASSFSGGLFRGTVALPFGQELCQLAIAPGGSTSTRPTQVQRIGRTSQRQLVQVHALVESGQLWDLLNVAPPAPSGSLLNAAALAVAQDPTAAVLDLEGQDLSHQFVPLTGFGTSAPTSREGPLRMTWVQRRATNYGGMQWWVDVDAAAPRIRITVNFHNGSPAPDAHFRSVKLNVRSGIAWAPFLQDPACDVGQNYLIRPANHVIPQRWERSFRLELRPIAQAQGWYPYGWGAADWGSGGFLPQGWAVPNLDHAGIDLASLRNEDQFRLASLLPSREWQNVDPPVSWLWPAQGTQYGGTTGGVGIECFAGVQAAASAQGEGLEVLAIDQLRWRSRQQGPIYLNGLPVRPDQNLVGGGAPWRYFDGRFELSGGIPQDDPFRFRDYAGTITGAEDYNPRLWDPVDAQHLTRVVKSTIALAWLDGDDYSRQCLEVDAALLRMQFWEGTGTAHRLSEPGTPAIGTDWGRGEAWAANLLAAAVAFAPEARRAEYDAWFNTYVHGNTIGQMLNGNFGAQNTGKMAEDPPFNSNFYVHRSQEQALTANSLYGIGTVTGSLVTTILENVARGLSIYGRPGNATGPWEIIPMGPSPGTTRYVTQAEIPAGLMDTVGTDAFAYAFVLAHGRLLDGLTEFVGLSSGASLAQILAVMMSWNLRAPNPQTGSPVENWSPVLALLQRGEW